MYLVPFKVCGFYEDRLNKIHFFIQNILLAPEPGINCFKEVSFLQRYLVRMASFKVSFIQRYLVRMASFKVGFLQRYLVRMASFKVGFIQIPGKDGEF